MESTIKKIFSGKSDEFVHNEFIKFSKGVFGNRYLVEAKKKKDGWKIKTSNEFANFLVRNCLEKINENVDMTGVIVSTFDIRNGMGGYVFKPEEEVKQFMGIKQLKVDSNVSPKRVIEAMNKFPKAFFALSFSGNNFKLKIKPKAPKSAKPSASGEKEVKAEFCSIETNEHNIVNDILFDCMSEPEVSIRHELHINEIVIPKGEKDPLKMRENAVRKGKIIRILKIGERETRKEASFEA